jgi:hypothetical protein
VNPFSKKIFNKLCVTLYKLKTIEMNGITASRIFKRV